MKINEFQEFWKMQTGKMSVDQYVDNRPLTKNELMNVRKMIETLQSKGLPSSKIIEALQKMNKKLIDKSRAERAFWTESKKMDTKLVVSASKELDVTKYRVVLSPNACPLCVEKSDGGKKIFDNRDVKKSGYGEFVPWHPNCYCIVLPVD